MLRSLVVDAPRSRPVAAQKERRVVVRLARVHGRALRLDGLERELHGVVDEAPRRAVVGLEQAAALARHGLDGAVVQPRAVPQRQRDGPVERHEAQRLLCGHAEEARRVTCGSARRAGKSSSPPAPNAAPTTAEGVRSSSKTCSPGRYNRQRRARRATRRAARAAAGRRVGMGCHSHSRCNIVSFHIHGRSWRWNPWSPCTGSAASPATW